MARKASPSGFSAGARPRGLSPHWRPPRCRPPRGWMRAWSAPTGAHLRPHGDGSQHRGGITAVAMNKGHTAETHTARSRLRDMRDRATCGRASAQTGAPRGPWMWMGLLGAVIKNPPSCALSQACALVCVCDTSVACLQERQDSAGGHPCSEPPGAALQETILATCLPRRHHRVALPACGSPGSPPSSAHRQSLGRVRGQCRGSRDTVGSPLGLLLRWSAEGLRSCLSWAPLVQRPGLSSQPLIGVRFKRRVQHTRRLCGREVGDEKPAPRP